MPHKMLLQNVAQYFFSHIVIPVIGLGVLTAVALGLSTPL